MASNDNWFGIEPPKDANGEIIPLDTETLYETDGQVFHVLAFRYLPKGREWSASGGYTGNKNGWCADTNRLLLAPPDSWEKLIGDLRKAADSPCSLVECDYIHPEGEGCENCPAKHENCSKYMFTDIANRIEKLMGASDD